MNRVSMWSYRSPPTVELPPPFTLLSPEAYLQRPRPDPFSQLLHIRVREHLPDHLPRSPLHPLEPLPLIIVSSPTALERVRIVVSSEILVGGDGGGARELLEAGLGLGGGGGVVGASAKVLVGGDALRKEGEGDGRGRDGRER
jgi:hypothetical protein